MQDPPPQPRRLLPPFSEHCSCRQVHGGTAAARAGGAVAAIMAHAAPVSDVRPPPLAAAAQGHPRHACGRACRRQRLVLSSLDTAPRCISRRTTVPRAASGRRTGRVVSWRFRAGGPAATSCCAVQRHPCPSAAPPSSFSSSSVALSGFQAADGGHGSGTYAMGLHRVHNLDDAVGRVSASRREE